MLWRALKHIERGFYIDIGAQDPVVDSVSLAFYEQGWRGVHVEPTPAYGEALRKARPDEIVVQAAIGHENALIPFYEIPETGISTGDVDIARRHGASGFAPKRIDVPCISLASLLDSYGDREIHWLKVDVEGMEMSVLKSWAPSGVRPWIVVLESTLPATQELSHGAWEEIILGLNYRFAYFDGLNRFYVSSLHEELLESFAIAPNLFDGFALAGTGSHPFCVKLNNDVAHARSLTRGIEDQLTAANEQVRINAEIAESSRTLLREEQILNGQLIEINRDQSVRATEALAERELRWTGALEVVQAALRRQEDICAQRDAALVLQTKFYLDRESDLHLRVEALSREGGQLESRLALTGERVREANELAASLRAETTEIQRQHATVAEANRQLREALAEAGLAHAAARDELVNIRTSWAWRLLHPWQRRQEGNGALRYQSALGIATGSAPDTAAALPIVTATEMQTAFAEGTGMEDREMTIPARAPEASVAYLLTLFDMAFVRGAYAVLLGREADPGGLATFLAKVRAGVAREDIIVGIATSEEGRSKGLKVEGLRNLTERTHTRVRRFLRRTFGNSETTIARQMRSVENRLAATGSEMEVRFGRLEATLRRIETSMSSERRLHVVSSARAASSEVGGQGFSGDTEGRVDAHTRLEQRLFDQMKSKVRT